MDWTVNPRLGGFDSHSGSQIVKAGNTQECDESIRKCTALPNELRFWLLCESLYREMIQVTVDDLEPSQQVHSIVL